MKKIFLIIQLLFFIATANDKPFLLGNPYSADYISGEAIYARNIWDMQYYQGKIYLGAGNSSNIGPAQNAGRVYIISLNPKTDKFHFDYKVAEEQIDLFKVYGNTLYVPGHDATQKWTYGNIYTQKNGKWNKFRTLPNALHVYDLVEKDGKIFTAVGLNKKGSVFISDKKAQKWRQLSQGRGRVYSLLEVADELFATKTFRLKDSKKLSMTQWSSRFNSFSSRYDLNIRKMFPNTKLKNDSIKIIKPLKFGNEALYIGAYKHNDHQNISFGLYKASIKNKILNIKKVKIQSGFIPRDIIKRKKSIYVLVTKDNIKNSQTKVLKFNKHNFSNYEEIIKFNYPSFARSFEEANGWFYFGIGSEVKSPKHWKQNELKKETGNILKLKWRK